MKFIVYCGGNVGHHNTLESAMAEAKRLGCDKYPAEVYQLCRVVSVERKVTVQEVGK